MLACYCDFQVSKYLELSSSDLVDDSQGEFFFSSRSHDHLFRVSDASLRLLVVTPLQLLAKTQKVNLANRIYDLLADRSMDQSTIAVALNMLILLMETPSNKMILLKKPYVTSEGSVSGGQDTSATWLFEIAAWLDEASRGIGPDVQAVMKLKQLAVLVLQ